jgi:hypothetical protein
MSDIKAQLNKGLIFFCGLFFLFSCKEKYLEPMEYIGYIENEKNGLIVSKEVGEYIFSAHYAPVEYCALKKLKEEHISSADLEKEKMEMDGLQYFNFRVELKNSGDILKSVSGSQQDYNHLVQHLSFGMQNDMALVENADTFPCRLFHFERTYGVAPYYTFVMAFDAGGNEKHSTSTLVYFDKIFGVGTLKFEIKEESKKNIPLLKTVS